jgi:hypothetical protein
VNIDLVTDIAKLEVAASRPDLRRDLHTFIAYVSPRDVKRGHRDNSIAKTDSRRLVKLLSDPAAEVELEETGNSWWLNIVDRIALQLGLVQYDTNGIYAGYSSQEPSFPDNFIKFDEQAYGKLLSLSVAKQERVLLDRLLEYGQGNGSELFSSPFGFGRLSRFSHRGSATGVVPMLDFTAIRRSLLKVLAACPTGEWLSVASLVEYLKTKDRYFLIPKKPQFKDKWSAGKGRYQNFRESAKSSWDDEIQINDTDADAFERVEGRYIEQFLEGLPHLLGYVEVAYGSPKNENLFPSLGVLQAFRVSERLQRVLAGTIAEPTLRVTPSFDAYLQSELYPARAIRDLQRVCEHVTQDTTNVFHLERQRVAAACASDPSLNVVALLESLSPEPLPANVRRELEDWAAHGDKFVLYLGYSLLETNKQEADIEKFRVENVSPGVDIVRSSDRLFTELERQQLAPLRVKHGEQAFSPLPDKTRSAFPSKAKAIKKKREAKTKVTLMRVTSVQLLCPDREFLERLQQLLTDVCCPVEADRTRLALSYSRQFEPEVTKAIRALKGEYEVKISDQ